MPDTKLARMEDIGGCRAILSNRDEIEGVLARINKNWDVKRQRDYIESPKSSVRFREAQRKVARWQARREEEVR